MMPAPTHLNGWILPSSDTIDEENFSGRVLCPCGCEEIQLYYPGQTQEYKGQEVPCTAEINGKFFFLVKAKCSACGNEKILFDADFHGWDGYVCHDSGQADLPRPDLITWNCQSCNSSIHNVQINIETQGKQDFIDETDGEFPEDRWVDGFSWIDFDIKCKECGAATKQWVSYETM
jgi:hypothetical protein